VRRTPLEEMYRRSEVTLLGREEYVRVVCDFLERLPAGMVIHRLNGDAPPDWLVAPAWCRDKAGLLRDIHAELGRRDSWQGKECRGRAPALGPARLPLRLV
jgi:radical SAM superfamily enzyme